MGNMYKETISRKKLPSVVKFFTILVAALFFAEIIKDININGQDIGRIAIVFCATLVVLTLVFEIFRCRVKYTYSIIADQFIIHKIKGSEDRVVENIKLRNIQYIGRNDMPKLNESIKSSKKYVCSIFNLNPYYCIYKDGDKLKRFYFEPSSKLIEKIRLNREKRLAS